MDALGIRTPYSGECEMQVRMRIQALDSSFLLRLHLRPLLRDVPFVGGVTVSFLQVPDIDFDLGGVANVLDLPGLGILLRHVIHDQLEQIAVVPHSIFISLVTLEVPRGEGDSQQGAGPVGVSLSRALSLPSGVLSVMAVEARDLVNTDWRLLGQGKSDPYAIVGLGADGGEHEFRTHVIPDCLDPVWKLLVDLPVDDPATLQDVSFEVWDRDAGVKDDFLGRCVIPLKVLRTALATGETQDVWRKLEEVRKGSFHAEVAWGELKITRPLVSAAADEHHKGVLVVLVDSCQNLLGGGRSSGLRLPHPYVKLELCGVQQQTETVLSSTNPVFAHRMCFLVRDPTADTLRLTVIDERHAGQSIGGLRIDLSDLLERSRLAVNNQQYLLTSRMARGERSPQVTLSLAFRYIHRPKTTSFGVHRSLEELQEIMQPTKEATPNPAINVTELPDQTESRDKNDQEMSSTVDPLLKDDQVKSLPTFPHIDDESSTTTSPIATLEREIHASEVSRQLLLQSSSPNDPSSPPATTSDQPPEKKRRSSPPSRRTPSRLDPRPRVQLSLKYSSADVTLSVVVHKVKNLQETEHTSLPSPYVKLYALESFSGIGNSSTRLARSKRKTQVRRNKVNPIFEETLHYYMHPDDVRHRRLEVCVCSDGGVLGRNRVLGRCIVPLQQKLKGGTSVTDWFPLHQPHERSVNGVRKSSSNVGDKTRQAEVKQEKPRRASLSGGWCI